MTVRIGVVSGLACLVLLSVSREGLAQDAQPVVTIQKYAFKPDTLSVPAGTLVTFKNADDTTHSVTASDGSFRSPPLSPGGTFQTTFKTAGTFGYFCGFHPFMEGHVTVTAKGDQKAPR